MFLMSDTWKHSSGASGLCSLSRPHQSIAEDKIIIIFFKSAKCTNLHILAFLLLWGSTHFQRPCGIVDILKQSAFVIVSRMLPLYGCSIFIFCGTITTLCYLNSRQKTFLDSASDFIWTIFSLQSQKPQSKGKSCWRWCGYLSLTNSQQRVGTVSRVVMMIYFLCTSFMPSSQETKNWSYS